MILNAPYRPSVIAGVISILLLAVGTFAVRGQVGWVQDASGAKILDGPVNGRINGKPVTFTSGKLRKTGNMGFGDVKLLHYTLQLREVEDFIHSKFDADVTVTVRAGELPDGKVFRADLAPRETRAGLRGEGYWVPELYSVRMTSRTGEEFGSGTDFVTADGTEELQKQDFTGRVEIERRKSGKVWARLYICYNDKLKSWIAGNIELEIDEDN